MRAYGKVDERQAHNVPLVEVCRSTAQSLTVNTGQHTDVSISDGIQGADLLRSVSQLGCVVENLVVVLHTLVHVVVHVVLSQLADQAVDTGITDQVDGLRISVGTHDGVEVTEDLTCHLHGHVDDVA